MMAAVIVTLTRPATWAYGLLGFLARGGLVIVAWPILVLPTPTGLQNDLGGPISRLVLGTPSIQMVALIVGGVVTGLLALSLATATGAWAERRGIEMALRAAVDEGLTVPAVDLDGTPGIGRIMVIRLLGLVPVAVAALLAWGSVYDAAYRELILPDDLITPLPLRVIRDVPWLLAGLALTWLVSDAAAATGVRRLLLDRRPVVVAWLLGWTDVARRPSRNLATALAGVVAVGLALGPALVTSSAGWANLRDALLKAREPWGPVIALVIWVALWLGGLVLVGAAAGIRAATWTIEAAGSPSRPSRPGRHDREPGRV